MKSKKYIFSLTLFFLFLISTVNVSAFSNILDDINKEKLIKSIEHIYNERSSCFIHGDSSKLDKYFQTSQKYGRYSLNHEVMRIKYLKNWSYQRGIKFTNVNSNINIRKISNKKGKLRVFLTETYKFDYIYLNDQSPVVNSFGTAIDHSLTLVNIDNNWIIYSDWYTDCFEDALKAYYINTNQSQVIKNKLDLPIFTPNEIESKGRYNRTKAIEYANKYCGVNWASGNTLSHNKKYKNFTGDGGDCTNFISQVLGDEDAGGLKFDHIWRCEYLPYGNSEGTTAWVNADAFKNYLIYSGKGSVVAKGSLIKLITTPESSYCSAVQKLQIGDLVCYAKGKDIDHFAVITGWDSHGYPLVNSHTTNRYRVPWDLGWGDSKINFYLIHINS